MFCATTFPLEKLKQWAQNKADAAFGVDVENLEVLSAHGKKFGHMYVIIIVYRTTSNPVNFKISLDARKTPSLNWPAGSERTPRKRLVSSDDRLPDCVALCLCAI